MFSFVWSWCSHPHTRLDKALKEVYPFLSHKVIHLWIEKGGIQINQRLAQKNTPLSPRDVVAIEDPTPILSIYPQPNPRILVSVCFENQDLLVINKPAGMPSHPLTPWDTDTAVQSVLAYQPALVGVGETRSPGLLHRLDNETSGLLAFAKNHHSYTIGCETLHRGLWKKEYLCWVHGILQHAQTIHHPICHHSSTSRMVLASSSSPSRKERGHPQTAITHVKPIAVRWLSSPSSPIPQPITAVWVQIETGVRHQIRVHLSSLGHSIVGDPLYAKIPPSIKTSPLAVSSHKVLIEDTAIPPNDCAEEHVSLPTDPGMMLHAWKLTLPATLCPTPISCPPPFPFPLLPE